MLVSNPRNTKTSHHEPPRPNPQSSQHLRRQVQSDRFRPRAVSGDDALASAHRLQSFLHQSASGPSLEDFASVSPSSGTSPLSTVADHFDGDSVTALSQLETASALFGIPSLDAAGSGLMPELWQDSLVPRSNGRSTHNRDASLSSFGSVAGPASPSPYLRTSVNPRIAVNDSSLNELDESLHAGVDPLGQHHYSVKSYGAQSADMLYGGLPVYHAMSSNNEIGAGSGQSASLMPPTGATTSSRRSHPVSVASSIMSSDSPATPSLGDPEDSASHPTSAIPTHGIPRFERTVTEAYGDELYSPNFQLTSSKEGPTLKMEPSRANELFAQAVHAANNQQHFGMQPAHSLHNPRGRSPFRNGAPLAPTQSVSTATRSDGSTTHTATPSPRPRPDANTAAGRMYGLAHTGEHQSEPNTPHTISPKDTFLEYHPADGDDDFTLFSPSSTAFGAVDATKLQQPGRNPSLLPAEPQHQSVANFGYYPAPVPFDVQSRMPQQYPFIRQQRMQPLMVPSAPVAGHGVQSPGDARHLPQSVGAGLSNKPAGASADGGTYTCTYHGCSLRFETPALLQKHKREGHRQAHGLNNTGRRVDPSQTTSLFNTQSGPHKCDRINPTTGKPCNTIFSRPYDLTRHEDTIHNIRKVKVRCELCTEEKTFSRADALTRHFRVCHPGVEIPAKHRRRGGH